MGGRGGEGFAVATGQLMTMASDEGYLIHQEQSQPLPVTPRLLTAGADGHGEPGQEAHEGGGLEVEAQGAEEVGGEPVEEEEVSPVIDAVGDHDGPGAGARDEAGDGDSGGGGGGVGGGGGGARRGGDGHGVLKERGGCVGCGGAWGAGAWGVSGWLNGVMCYGEDDL